MTHEKGWAITGAVGLVGSAMFVLAAREWIRSMFADIGPARAADVVLFGVAGACGGVVLLGLAFVALLLLVGRRDQVPALSVRSPDVVDVEPAERWLPAGRSSFADAGEATKLALAMRETMRPRGIPPTDDNIRELFQVTSNTLIGAAVEYLRVRGDISPGTAGRARTWTGSQAGG